METFVKFYFWWHVVIIVIRAIVLSTVPYPRVVKHKVGDDVLALMMLIGFAIWAGFLLYA